MTTKEILKIEFEILREELIAEYDRLGMRASGDFERESEVQVTETSAKLIGLSYAEQLESGREPGGLPPIQAIEKWIVDKGLVSKLRENQTVTSFAWAIAKKIEREGWKRQEHGGVNLLSNVITDKRIQDIIDKVGNELIQRFTLDILEELKTIYA